MTTNEKLYFWIGVVTVGWEGTQLFIACVVWLATRKWKPWRSDAWRIVLRRGGP